MGSGLGLGGVRVRVRVRVRIRVVVRDVVRVGIRVGAELGVRDLELAVDELAWREPVEGVDQPVAQVGRPLIRVRAWTWFRARVRLGSGLALGLWGWGWGWGKRAGVWGWGRGWGHRHQRRQAVNVVKRRGADDHGCPRVDRVDSMRHLCVEGADSLLRDVAAVCEGAAYARLGEQLVRRCPRQGSSV